MPTATWKSRLRSGSAHYDLQLAVEVRQCPLGSGARGGGPAVPTGIWTARRRRRVRRRRRQRRRRRRRTALIKSNNPHLAGGEKQNLHFPQFCCVCFLVFSLILVFYFVFFVRSGFVFFVKPYILCVAGLITLGVAFQDISHLIHVMINIKHDV